jgi:hypothetical protein
VIVLGIILGILGYFLFRPLMWIGVALIIVGIILWAAAVPGPFAGQYY